MDAIGSLMQHLLNSAHLHHPQKDLLRVQFHLPACWKVTCLSSLCPYDPAPSFRGVGRKADPTVSFQCPQNRLTQVALWWYVMDHSIFRKEPNCSQGILAAQTAAKSRDNVAALSGYAAPPEDLAHQEGPKRKPQCCGPQDCWPRV